MPNIKPKAISALFNYVITTADKYESSSSGLELDFNKISGAMMPHQTVISVGPTVKGIAVGDIVKINPRRYYYVEQRSLGVNADNVEEHEAMLKAKWPTINVNGRTLLKIGDNDIDYVVTDYDDLDSPIVDTRPSVIMPQSNIII